MNNVEYNSYWQEDLSLKILNDIADLVCVIKCRSLPVDHAWELSQAIQKILPWWNSEPHSGLHLIHGGDSGNGWQRPEIATDIIYLTKRTRLILRLPRSKLADAHQLLQGKNLIIAGHSLLIENSTERLLTYHPTLYARHVTISVNDDNDEITFLAAVTQELKKIGITIKKMLAGKSHILTTPNGNLPMRSLLVADLNLENSLELQRCGIGKLRTLGCGLFIPHKNLA